MAVLTSYFDASGSPSLEVVAVSGLVSTPEKWNAFNGDWNECLSVHGVSALHMKHFSQFRGEFSSWDEPVAMRDCGTTMRLTPNICSLNSCGLIHWRA